MFFSTLIDFKGCQKQSSLICLMEFSFWSDIYCFASAQSDELCSCEPL